VPRGIMGVDDGTLTMTRRAWLLLTTGVLLPGAAPARAGGTPLVAVLPARVWKGAAGNGAVFTEALKASLTKRAMGVVPAAKVEAELRAARIDLSKPVPVAELAKLRAALGADYVVYPRVLSVGVGVNAQEFSANILLNVVGTSGSSFFHTRQIGQVFRPRVATAEAATMSRGDADAAAEKLLAGFYTKVGAK
jgi:hypothetical protein